ncbi:MAG TPA: hypothetical protein PKC65_05695 [Pyrinomonadaceae bacterium]|nr:hypothetical protein [Pyrinomonadaceae bacterium]
MLTAIERTGTVRPNREIVLDDALPKETPERVRVIVLYDEKMASNVPQRRRKAGSAAGKITISDSFDEPLGEFEDYQ